MMSRRGSILPLGVASVSATGAVVVAQTAASAVPDAQRAIDEAAQHGYEAVVLVLIILTVFALFTWAVRCWIMQSIMRDERLANRVTALEDKITGQLFTALGESTKAINHNSDALKKIDGALESLTAQVSRFGDSLIRLETVIRDHDARVDEYTARAAGEIAKITGTKTVSGGT